MPPTPKPKKLLQVHVYVWTTGPGRVQALIGGKWMNCPGGLSEARKLAERNGCAGIKITPL